MSYTVICPACEERNPGNLLHCQKCQTSLVGIPREEYPPVRSKPLIQETVPLPKPGKPVEESLPAKLFLLLAKTFGIACAIGVSVSVTGWRYLHWSSTRQFSDGLFWTGAALAVLSYYVYRSELNGRRFMLTAVYVQPAGTLSMQQRTRNWIADAASHYRMVFHFFLVTVYLIVFSALTWFLF